MNTTRYLQLLPLLLFAAACQPEPGQPGPADPDGDAAAPPAAMNDTPAPSAQQTGQQAAPRQIAEVKIAATEGNKAGGTVRFIPEGNTTRIEGTITGLAPGTHGWHIHAKGDCSAPDAKSAGDHFSPDNNPHGSPEDPPAEHHLGDLGNLVADEQGKAAVQAEDAEIRLSGKNSVIGKALIVHAGPDDLESQPSGDSGGRVGCGVIREAVQTADLRSRRGPSDDPEGDTP